MAKCPDDKDMDIQASQPQGFGDAVTTSGNGPNAASINMDGKAADAEDVFTKAQAVLNVAQAIPTGQNVSSTPSQVSGLTATAKKLANWISKATETFNQRVVDDYQQAYGESAGMTRGKQTFWLTVENWMARKFTNHRAGFANWCALFSNDTSRALLDNLLVRDLQNSAQRIAGQNAVFQERLAGIVNTYAKPIADRLGYTPVEVAQIAGDWAIARHIPEANARILQRWKAEVEQLVAEGVSGNDPAMKRLRSQISDLEKYLDWDDMAKAEADMAQRRAEVDSKRIEKLRAAGKLDEVDELLNRPEVAPHLYTAGYTNGEAAALMDKIRKLGFTDEEMNTIASEYTAFADHVLQARIDAGMVDPTLLQDFPQDWQYYVPVRSKAANRSGVVNDAHPYNPGYYHAMRGTTERPENAYSSLLHYSRRAANEIGMKDFSTRFAATAMEHQTTGKSDTSGIRIDDAETIKEMRRSGNPALMQYAKRFEETAGLIADIPVTLPDGSVIVKRHYVGFDPNWEDKSSGLRGFELNEALISSPKIAGGFNVAAKLTSGYGRLFTYYNPTFAPVNTSRDLIERSWHIASTEMLTEDGTSVRGMDLLGRYFSNSGRASKLLMQVMTGKDVGDGELGRLYQEFKEEGLSMSYRHTLDETSRSLSDILNPEAPTGFVAKALNKPEYAQLKSTLQGGKKGHNWIIGKLDRYNDAFNNVAGFAHYITLREAGVSRADAAAKVGQSMSAYTLGEATPVIRALYPFVRPTFQSAAAMARSFGFTYDPRGFMYAGKNSWKYTLGAATALLMLKPMLDEALGEDETTGASRLDLIPLSSLARMLPIGVDNEGGYLRFPISAGGPASVISTLVFGADRLARGVIDPGDFASEVLFTSVRALAPGNWPEYNVGDKPFTYLMQAFTPTILDPISEVAFNTTYFGSPVTTRTAEGWKSMAEQGKLGTEKKWHQAAREILHTTGLDYAPEQYKSVWENLAVGPFAILDSIFGDDADFRKAGAEATARESLHPLLRAFGASMVYGRVANEGRTLFYQAADHYQDLVKQRGVKLTSSTAYDSRDKEARRAWQTTQLKQGGFSDAEIEDILAIESAQGSIGSINAALNQEAKPAWLEGETSDDLRRLFEEAIMKESDIYNSTVNGLNLFRSRL